MSRVRTNWQGEQTFACRLPIALVQQLRLEAVRSGKTIRSIVTDALNSTLPKIEVVVSERGRRRNHRGDDIRRAAEA